MERAEIWEILLERQVAKVEVQYSGGHDEGHIHDVTVTYQDGQTEDFDRSPLKPIAELEDDLEQPVWDKYYGFAFEGEASGTVTWYTDTRKVILSGQETDWVDVPNEEM